MKKYICLIFVMLTVFSMMAGCTKNELAGVEIPNLSDSIIGTWYDNDNSGISYTFFKANEDGETLGQISITTETSYSVLNIPFTYAVYEDQLIINANESETNGEILDVINNSKDANDYVCRFAESGNENVIFYGTGEDGKIFVREGYYYMLSEDDAATISQSGDTYQRVDG